MHNHFIAWDGIPMHSADCPLRCTSCNDLNSRESP